MIVNQQISKSPIEDGETSAGGRDRHILLAHGGGGQLTDELIRRDILPRLGNDVLGELLDAADLPPTGDGRMALTIDSYVVTPWQFPGGDIGRLAVSGTVNDLAVCGAQPVGLALGLIIAEGFARSDLMTILDSIATAAREAGVPVTTGDTKVVGRDQADGIYITTAGVGVVPKDRRLRATRVHPGDVLLINGSIGEHGLAVMLAREMPEVRSVLRSDARPLNGLCEQLLDGLGDDVLFMRDATRGGLAGVAADLAHESGWRVALDETSIPLRPQANHAAEMLGLDPLDIANEGKVVVVVRPDRAAEALAIMRSDAAADQPAIIGEITGDADGLCELRTAIGGRRVIQKPYGEQLPRIC